MIPSFGVRPSSIAYLYPSNCSLVDWGRCVPLSDSDVIFFSMTEFTTTLGRLFGVRITNLNAETLVQAVYAECGWKMDPKIADLIAEISTMKRRNERTHKDMALRAVALRSQRALPWPLQPSTAFMMVPEPKPKTFESLGSLHRFSLLPLQHQYLRHDASASPVALPSEPALPAPSHVEDISAKVSEGSSVLVASAPVVVELVPEDTEKALLDGTVAPLEEVSAPPEQEVVSKQDFVMREPKSIEDLRSDLERMPDFRIFFDAKPTTPLPEWQSLFIRWVTHFKGAKEQKDPTKLELSLATVNDIPVLFRWVNIGRLFRLLHDLCRLQSGHYMRWSDTDISVMKGLSRYEGGDGQRFSKENLSVHLMRQESLIPKDSVEKVRSRGGFSWQIFDTAYGSLGYCRACYSVLLCPPWWARRMVRVSRQKAYSDIRRFRQVQEDRT
eukprot:TRINITY_DN1512_c0_g1_i12.p1 TRINITY_DN1512_c0_g1~~TRINITY_DN1512_c0_g1_i12.p1  ORF type:complete len:442 (+),score=40.69 TRINITY_DN1512_c0_g1_i12:782-2107(+)